MRRCLSLVVPALILAILACNAPQPGGTVCPTERPIAVCTPPACDEGEVYYCEGECPGGCGTQCATPTAKGPTATPLTVDPTDTPIIMCTPPPCAEDEVYYCDGECLGGCGTQCATPTPEEATATPVAPTDTPSVVCTPPPCTADKVYYWEGECPGSCGTQCATPTAAPQSLPIILSFMADRTTVVEGESVTLSWLATGGAEADIQWTSREGTLVNAPGPLNPNGGMVTIAPTGDGDLVLIVRDSTGSAEAHIQLTIASP